MKEKWEASGWAKKLAARQSRKVCFLLLRYEAVFVWLAHGEMDEDTEIKTASGSRDRERLEYGTRMLAGWTPMSRMPEAMSD